MFLVFLCSKITYSYVRANWPSRRTLRVNIRKSLCWGTSDSMKIYKWDYVGRSHFESVFLGSWIAVSQAYMLYI